MLLLPGQKQVLLQIVQDGNQHRLRIRLQRQIADLTQLGICGIKPFISNETGISTKNVEEILQGGLLNMSITDFYRHYGDGDSEETMEEVAADGTSQTEELYFRMEKAEEVMAAFEALNYRERAIVADHLGFCRDCYATYYYDTDDLNEDGNPKRKPRRKVPFIELAVEHSLASPDTADKTYRRALAKMRQKLSE